MQTNLKESNSESGNPPIRIRRMLPSDRNYVITTWLMSYRHHTSWNLLQKMPLKEYNIRFRRIINRILSLSDTYVDIAYCPEVDEDTIIGFAVYQPRTIHYVHTKQAFEGMGVAKQLLSPFSELSCEIQYSCKTDNVKNYRFPENWVFCPWLLIGLGDIVENGIIENQNQGIRLSEGKDGK